jgi:hypothetical protein
VLVKITRGLGGRKGVAILIMTGVIGLLAVLAGWEARRKMLSPKGVPAAVLPPEKILELGEQARGSMPEVPYVAGDMAKVASYAVAKRDAGTWNGLPAGAVLRVTGTEIKDGETWVLGRVQGGVRNENVVVHGSFLERYLPVVLDKTMELSDVRLVHVSEVPLQMSVTGWLRNITSQTISQCVVTCVFQDQNGREVDAQRTTDLVLPPLDLIRFETGTTDKEKTFRSFSIQITHATPDGLRNYLSTIVVQRSTLH